MQTAAAATSSASRDQQACPRAPGQPQLRELVEQAQQAAAAAAERRPEAEAAPVTWASLHALPQAPLPRVDLLRGLPMLCLCRPCWPVSRTHCELSPCSILQPLVHQQQGRLPRSAGRAGTCIQACLAALVVVSAAGPSLTASAAALAAASLLALALLLAACNPCAFMQPQFAQPAAQQRQVGAPGEPVGAIGAANIRVGTLM